MSGYCMSRYVMACDGCQQEFGAGGEYETSVECRAAAYTLGWRFPPKINTGGKVTKGLASDVCPDCLDGWQGQLTDQAARRKLAKESAA